MQETKKITSQRKHTSMQSHRYLLTALISAATIISAQAENKTVTNMLGDDRVLYDSDDDGWDDLWLAIFPDIKHRDKKTDTDGDTISDYDEMLLWRDPMVEGPPPRKLTPEELEKARLESEAAAAIALEAKREFLADKIEAGRQVALRATEPLAPVVMPTQAEKLQTLATMGEQILERQKADFKRVQEAPMDEKLRRALSPEFGLVPMKGENGQISIMGTDNVTAAGTISIDDIWPGGSSPLPDVTGAGRLIGVWEAGGGVLATHNEFQLGGSSRVIQRDSPAASNLPLAHNHATQVTGTLAAAGFVAGTRGGAFNAEIDAFDSVGDIGEMAIAASQGLTLSNHSYSFRAGWLFLNGFGWTWIGRDIAGEDPTFGLYTRLAREIDLLVYQSDSYLPVFSSSNEVGDTGPVNITTGLIPAGTAYWLALDTDGDGNIDTLAPDNTTHAPDGGNPLPGAITPGGGFPPLGLGLDTVKPQACAKNSLVVGAISDVAAGIQNGTDAQIAFFSSRGPTDDGRLKPDLVANGTDMVTTDFLAAQPTFTDRYTTGISGATTPVSGTSFSTPSVTGAVALVQEMNQVTNGSPLWASSLKAVMIHTADDATDLPTATGLGAVVFTGPDFFYGWGVANTTRASTFVRDNNATQSGRTGLRQHALFSGNTVDIPVVWDGTSGQMRFTIAWTDPAFQSLAVASAQEGVPVVTNATVADDATVRLINDLDIRVFAPGGATLLPWRLDHTNPTAPATLGDNTRDNVEQVVVPAPVAGTYTVRISHKGSLRSAAAIQPGHPQYDANLVRYELTSGQQQRFSLALSGNKELPGDRFAITSMDRIGNDSLLEWQSVKGLRYQLETSADLVTWTAVGGPVNATLPLTPFLTTEAASADKKFYPVIEVGR